MKRQHPKWLSRREFLASSSQVGLFAWLLQPLARRLPADLLRGGEWQLSVSPQLLDSGLAMQFDYQVPELPVDLAIYEAESNILAWLQPLPAAAGSLQIAVGLAGIEGGRAYIATFLPSIPAAPVGKRGGPPAVPFVAILYPQAGRRFLMRLPIILRRPS